MANLRRFSQDIQDANQSDGGGNAYGDQPSPDEGADVGRTKVMPTPEYTPGDTANPDGRQAHQIAQGGETPRERGDMQQQQQFQSAPRQPQVPTPMAGTEQTMGGGPQGTIPFTPMGGPDAASQASPRLRSLFGGGSGLTGGGLGVPLDPISNQQSDPINMLMQLLQGR